MVLGHCAGKIARPGCISAARAGIWRQAVQPRLYTEPGGTLIYWS